MFGVGVPRSPSPLVFDLDPEVRRLLDNRLLDPNIQALVRDYDLRLVADIGDSHGVLSGFGCGPSLKRPRRRSRV
jgi:hypothetical protein